MTTRLPADWRAGVVPCEPARVHDRYPLASLGGVQMLQQVMAAHTIWRALTRAQREVLLAAVAGFPIVSPVPTRRLERRGLLAADGSLEPTLAGRMVVEWRPL